MTCDVEDYFQVSAFEGLIPRARWKDVECRIPRNVDRILALLSDAGTRGTFFVLGWVARNHASVVRRIAAEGHEIASHGMDHTRVWAQEPEEFLQDARDTKALLEDVSSTPVTGYRAASWSVDSRTPWFFDKVAEAGYRYSSSVYPFGRPSKTGSGFHPEPFRVSESGILEVPASTVTILGGRIPAAGGGYFRLFPLNLSLKLIRMHERRSDFPFVFYFHPWELDPDQPRLPGSSFKSRFRHYLNLHSFEHRFRTVVNAFSWDRMDSLFLEQP